MKVNRTRAFIQKNAHHCPQHIKETCYRIFIRPILEYAAPGWDPSTKKSIAQLESVQRRSARYATNTYDCTASVTSILEDLGWAKPNPVILLYRIVFNLVDIPHEPQSRPRLPIPDTFLNGHTPPELLLPPDSQNIEPPATNSSPLPMPSGLQVWPCGSDPGLLSFLPCT